MSARFSQPKDKSDLLKRLTGPDGPFKELRDALFFAAVVGYSNGRRRPHNAVGEGIRWEVMTNRLGTEDVTDMIAAASYPDDKEILAAPRIGERIKILEEYANGGLALIESRLAQQQTIPARRVLLDLVLEALSADPAVGEDLTSMMLNL